MKYLTTSNSLIIRQLLKNNVYNIPASAGSPKLLGSKKADLLVIVKARSVDNEYIPLATKKALLAMLRHGGYTLDHAAILNIAGYAGISWRTLRQQVPAKKVLFMGILPEQLGLQVQCPSYTIFPLNDVQLMHTESLEQMSKGSEHKRRKQWAAIKRIF